MLLSTWRSARKYPSNRLCTRGFARELKIALLGSAGTTLDYPDVERAFYDRTGAELGKATWHGWWHGHRVPNATYRSIADREFAGLASKWFYRSDDSDRLQCHLSALDLGWMVKNHSADEAFQEAWRFLLTLHRDWGPEYRGEIYLPAPAAREGLGRQAFVSRKAKPDPRVSIPIGLTKGPRSRLRSLATGEAAFLFEPLNPSSVLSFMLRYGVESRLPDPGLKEAFILDFLTAAAASLCLLQMVAPRRVPHWGRPGQILFACHEHFWMPDYGHEDPLWMVNEPFAMGFAKILDELAVEHDYHETRSLFYELKDTYYSAMAVTGLSTEALIAFANDNLCRRDLGQSWDS